MRQARLSLLKMCSSHSSIPSYIICYAGILWTIVLYLVYYKNVSYTMAWHEFIWKHLEFLTKDSSEDETEACGSDSEQDNKSAYAQL